MGTDSKFEPRTPEQQALLIRVAKAALATPKALDMANWHRCETTHCIAGWAMVLAKDQRYPVLYNADGSWDYMKEDYDPDDAGEELLGCKAARYFRADDETAREWLESVLLEAGEEIPSWVQDGGKETEE